MSLKTVLSIENTLISTTDSKERLNLHLEAAKIWESESRYQSSITHYESAIGYLSKLEDIASQKKCAEAHLNTGHLYRSLGKNRQAGAHYKQTISLFKSVYKDTPSDVLAGAYYSVATFLDNIWKIELASSYYKEALSQLSKLSGNYEAQIAVIQSKLTTLNNKPHSLPK